DARLAGLEVNLQHLPELPLRNDCGLRIEDGDTAGRGMRSEHGKRLWLTGALAVAAREAPVLAGADDGQPVTRRLGAEIVALIHAGQQLARARNEGKPVSRADA